MNNEPVAYWDGKHFASKDKSSLADIPLYTHPVKEQELLGEIAQLKAELDTANKAYMWMDETYRGVLVELDLLKAHPVKELTDEEILEICDLGEWHRDEFAINFARAILRKAQEK